MSTRLLTPEEKTNVQVTTNFNVKELEFYDTVPPELVANATKLLQNLQIIRDFIGKPVKIISGYRSEARNKAVGGKNKSLHLQAAAADIQITGMIAKDIHSKIEELIKQKKLYNGGLGLYVKSNFVHYDVRDNGPARWNGD